MIFEATKWLQCCRTSYSHGRLSTSRFTLSGFYTRALASQLTLCTPFASVLSGFSTNSLHTFCIRSLRLLNYLCVSLPFFRPSDHVSRNARGQGHAGPFHETTHLKRPNDTLMYPTMPRLLQLCLRFGRYLRPNILVSPILHVYALYNILRIIIFFLIGKTTL